MIDYNKLLLDDYKNKGIKLYFYTNSQMYHLHGYCDWIDPVLKISRIDNQLVIDNGRYDYFYILSEIKKYRIYELKDGK